MEDLVSLDCDCLCKAEWLTLISLWLTYLTKHKVFKALLYCSTYCNSPFQKAQWHALAQCSAIPVGWWAVSTSWLFDWWMLGHINIWVPSFMCVSVCGLLSGPSPWCPLLWGHRTLLADIKAHPPGTHPHRPWVSTSSGPPRQWQSDVLACPVRLKIQQMTNNSFIP